MSRMHYLFISGEEDLNTESDELPLGCSMHVTNKSQQYKWALARMLWPTLAAFSFDIFPRLQLHFFFPVANRAAPPRRRVQMRALSAADAHTQCRTQSALVWRAWRIRFIIYCTWRAKTLANVAARFKLRSNFCEKSSNAPLYCVQRNDRAPEKSEKTRREAHTELLSTRENFQ
jgi:hypothetical protein